MRLKVIRYQDIEQYPTYFKLRQNVKEDFFGSAPAPFIGRVGYPNVNVGLLAPQETSHEAWMHDAPRFWAANNFSIPKVADLRLSLVNSRAKSNVKFVGKIVSLAQEVGLAEKPVDIEVHLKKKPILKPLSDYMVTPMGPSAQIKVARITENAKINQKVQKAHYDTDLKAGEAVKDLYKHEIDENALARILSVGALGVGKNRKLVPTRWSITAIDDTLGKEAILKIKDYPESEYAAYFGNFFGNYFFVMFLSDIWSYELFEMYMPKTGINKSEELKYTTDYENYEGRKSYAESTAGGYYSSRLPILEKLKEKGRQASVLVLRFITDEYTTPLGVWVVREAVRKTMAATPVEFASKELMLEYVRQFVKMKFRFDAEQILNKSNILRNQLVQRKLAEYI